MWPWRSLSTIGKPLQCCVLWSLGLCIASLPCLAEISKKDLLSPLLQPSFQRITLKMKMKRMQTTLSKFSQYLWAAIPGRASRGHHAPGFLQLLSAAMLSEQMSAAYSVRSKCLLGRKSMKSTAGLCKQPYNVHLCVGTRLCLCLPQCSGFFLGGRDNGALWTHRPCHAKGVTCVCHK